MDSDTIIYLDHAATVPMRPEALAAMSEALADVWGNASAIYSAGSRAKRRLERARAALAATIGADPSEIYFTSGGTEGDNWALTSAMELYASQNPTNADPSRSASAQSDPSRPASAQSDPSRPDSSRLDPSRSDPSRPSGHLIISAVEHHAVLHTADHLKARGFDVTVIMPDSEGVISPEAVTEAIRKDTALISVMMANNEIGTIEPVAEIARIAREKHILFHTDAVQAYGKVPIDVRALGADLLSVSAHKIGGPKGIGFLYVRKNMPFGAYMHGGMQEKGRRAGTENVPAAVGFAAAAEAAIRDMEASRERELELQRYFLRRLREEIPEVGLNGPEPGDFSGDSAQGSVMEGDARNEGVRQPEQFPLKRGFRGLRRLPNNLNIRFPGINSETLLILLDMQGICASGGSACTTGAINPSHVLTAIGRTEEEAKESVRFTLGAENTEEELERTVAAVKEIIERLKSIK